MNATDRDALLAQLRDAHAPPVSGWPAPGWWALALLLLVLLALLLWRYRHRRRRLWQRQAQTELARIREHSSAQPVSRTLADCSTLCRRVLMVARGREHSAALHGQAWLDALDAVAGRALFAGGFGRLLEAGPYQRAPEVGQHDLESLFDAIDELIRAASRPGSQSASRTVSGTDGRSGPGSAATSPSSSEEHRA